MIETEIRSVLLADPTVQELVGDRIYPEQLPQRAQYPAITFHRIHSEDLQTYGGRTYLVRMRLQVSIWVRAGDGLPHPYGVKRRLSLAVRRCLAGYRRGTAIAMTHSSEVDLPFDPESEVWHVANDFIVMAVEAEE